MKVILDTNVLLAALISPSGHPSQIFDAWQEKKFSLLTAPAQLEEIRKASRYPKLQKILHPSQIGTLINNLQNSAIVTELQPLHASVTLPDSNDEFLLQIALAGAADYLVTGDSRAGLHAMRSFGRTRIVTPSAFCAEVL